MIEGDTITDKEVDALTICDQQSRRCQPPDIFFTLEDKGSFPPISFHMPGTGRSKTRNLANTLDFGHEIASGKVFLKKLTGFIRKNTQFLDPRKLMAM